jgi:hypothetical protein
LWSVTLACAFAAANARSPMAREMSRRERLYGESIDEASRLLADALTHHLEEPSKMVPSTRSWES